ncbi:Tetratricopeptide repeat-containing protein [Paenibacillus polysaccharolyticus]|uniref:Tetratricopeptide repeat-containing protein n=3 Tax=Paenibacillus TaxID=44249 RepID=A0A1G5EJ40_9BACL|nr:MULTISPECIES: tetratricopeptide repeat protein [Paenibacillus]MBY0203389.1 tetratricopeptide repeat protein [Paenibacillus cucumis (ex Kampfer et al. 2016)]SCY26975.1 Tetratricopeptide repeat-containing protein [Paenibacillus polysaccharolyticus]
MFQHVFAEMNDMLDEIIKSYPSAEGLNKQELQQKWNLLKRMSDGMLDEWLMFEEKMSQIRERELDKPASLEPEQEAVTALPELHLECFSRGQGYFKLQMYPQAIDQFLRVVNDYPDSALARFYLALAHLSLEQIYESETHLQQIMLLKGSARLKGLVCNALGCIQAKLSNPEAACSLFAQALQYDPTLTEPLYNMEVCRLNRGKLQYANQLGCV